MTDEQHEGWMRFGLIALISGVGLALVLMGHDEGYWAFVAVAWMLFGII